jgi:glucokinase
LLILLKLFPIIKYSETSLIKSYQKKIMTEVVAGVDIGGTNTVFGLVTLSGEIIANGKLKTGKYPRLDGFVTALADGLSGLASEKGKITIRSIGIGAPNANFHRGTIELAPNLAWKGIVPLAELLTKKIGLPVVMTNDANAAALGEMIFGSAKFIRDFIVLTLGTGVGSGIVINGEVVYGHTGFAGELGHMIVIPSGRECGCGRQGCLETYASATGLVRTTLYMLSEMKNDSPLRSIPPSQLTSRIIAEAALKKDSIALEVFDYTAEILALGIINAVTFSSPKAIFLFGGLAKAGDLLFKPVREYVDKNIQPIFRGTVDILPSGLPDSNAAVLGAAALAYKELSR